MRESSTEQQFSQALERVMNKKSISKIRISDLIEESNLSRQTFYRHFRDIYDLIDWTHLYKVQLAFDLMDIGDDIVHSATVFFQLIAQNKDFYRKIITIEGYNSFYNGFYNRCQHNLLRMAGGENACDDITRFSIRFTAAGCAQILQEWIESDMAQPPEKMARLIIETLPPKLLMELKKAL